MFDPQDPRYSRIRQFVGTDALIRLHESRVLVVGLGAVGSYAVEGLARAGVGRLRLIDFDIIQPSNINRQLYALQSTVGIPKTTAALARVRDINPDCDVEAERIFVHTDTLDEVFGDFSPDFVVDAIDALTPKVELMCEIRRRGLRGVSSMGAALRSDPTKIAIGRLRDVHGCPLARMVKKRFRSRGEPMEAVCVYSSEDVSRVRIALLGEPEPRVSEGFERGRLRNVLGSLPTLTGIFGLTIANHVIQKLIEE
ncbi:MAG: tRNA threonylcarbamoyladenosine dehydratase [Planctomycetia bacterium]|nr:tRNA threonylcarbamoyladenosine dehydratase [Planctomycetia bacterium]